MQEKSVEQLIRDKVVELNNDLPPTREINDRAISSVFKDVYNGAINETDSTKFAQQFSKLAQLYDKMPQENKGESLNQLCGIYQNSVERLTDNGPNNQLQANIDSLKSIQSTFNKRWNDQSIQLKNQVENKDQIAATDKRLSDFVTTTSKGIEVPKAQSTPSQPLASQPILNEAKKSDGVAKPVESAASLIQKFTPSLKTVAVLVSVAIVAVAILAPYALPLVIGIGAALAGVTVALKMTGLLEKALDFGSKLLAKPDKGIEQPAKELSKAQSVAKSPTLEEKSRGAQAVLDELTPQEKAAAASKVAADLQKLNEGKTLAQLTNKEGEVQADKPLPKLTPEQMAILRAAREREMEAIVKRPVAIEPIDNPQAKNPIEAGKPLPPIPPTVDAKVEPTAAHVVPNKPLPPIPEQNTKSEEVTKGPVVSTAQSIDSSKADQLSSLPKSPDWPPMAIPNEQTPPLIPQTDKLDRANKGIENSIPENIKNSLDMKNVVSNIKQATDKQPDALNSASNRSRSQSTPAPVAR